MAIPGIGLQTTPQNLLSSSRIPVKSAVDASKNESETGNVAEKAQGTAANNALFSAVPESSDVTQSISSRRGLAELEAARNRFQLQQEGLLSQGESGKAVQSFLDIANFERKDELINLVGIDIFI